MADISYGTGGGNLDDLVRRAQAAAQASDELRRKEEERSQVEERASAADEVQERVRTDVGTATRELSSAIERNTATLLGETGAVEANTQAWVRNAEARAAAISAGSRGVSAAALSVEAAASAPVSNLESANAVLTARRQAEQAAAQAAQVAEINRVAATISRAPSAVPASPAVTTAGAESVAAAVQAAERPSAMFQTTPGQAEALRRSVAQQASVVSGVGRVQGAVEGPARQAEAEQAQAMQQRIAAARAAAQEETELQAREAAHSELLSQLAARQRAVTATVNEASAAYSESANVLQRHGALTSEFIAAFARGDVTLREFGDQMIATIGKFSGWAIAGAAVYGVFKMFEDLKNGATETASAVSQLGRFIPGLGGPAGGGRGQVNAAETTVRNISTQFNVPISDVTNAMMVMARTFHTVSEAGEATRAVLAAVRLDQVPEAQATQYLTGIAQSMGFTHGGQLTGVINGLNELQYQYGARVSQTLPGVARGAPAAIAGGLDLPALEATTALGVRAGLTGNQVGTAITRSITNFAFSGGSDITFRRYGITPEVGNYGQLIRDVASTIDTRARAGTLSGGDLRNMATALGGPQLSRVFLPLLAQEAGRPGTLNQLIGAAGDPRRGYQEDLNAVLNTTTERFRAIGIALQNFGSRLAQIGAFQPLIATLDVVRDVVRLLELLTNPLVQLAGLFNQLPGPVRDVIAIFIAARAARALYNTSFGSNVQGFIGRLPGLDALDSQPRQAVRTTLSRLRTSVLPQAQQDESRADLARLRAANQLQSAYERQIAAVQSGVGIGEAADEVKAAETGLARATQRASDAGAHVAQVKADISVLSDREYDTQQKVNYMLERQLVATTETVNLQEEYLTQARATIRGGGGAQAAVAAAGAARVPTAGGGAGAAELAAPAAAIAESAVLMSQTVRAAAGTAAPGVVPLAPGAGAAIAAEGEGAAAMSTAQALRMGVFGGVWTGRPGAVVDRAQAVGSGALSRIRGMSPEAMTNAALFAGLFGTQIAASAVGGGPGQFIGNVGGQAVTGALLASMLRGGSPAAALAGGTAGTIAGSFQTNRSAGIGSAAGAAVGAGIGAAVGTLTDVVSGPLGTLIGAQLGSMAGSVIGGLIGGGGGGSATTSANRWAALARAPGALQTDFLAQLQTAYSGSGSGQQRAQQNISTTIQRLQAETQLFGPNTQQGQVAAQNLTALTTAAIQQAGTDPTTAMQILQTATQARSTVLQNQLQGRLATAAPGGATAQGEYIAGQYQNLYQSTYGAALGEAQRNFADASQYYDHLQQRYSGTEMTDAARKQLEAARTQAQQARAALQVAQAITPAAREASQLAQQQAYAAGYQQDQQTLQAQGNLAVARAGGNRGEALAAQLRTQRELLTNAQGATRLGPTAQANEIAKAQADLANTQVQIAQQGLTELQSRGQVAAARVPVGDPVQQSRVALQNAQRSWQYMRDHANAFDPSQIAQAYATVLSSRQALTQAIEQYQTQMSDLTTQIAQAQDFGDSVAQAQAGIAGATRDVQIASRYGTPLQRRQAQLGLISARNAAQQAGFERIGAAAQTQAGQEWGDPVAQAQTMVQAAQRQLAIARGFDEQNQALSALAAAQQQLHQALLANIQAEGQLQETLATGDTVQQARIAIQTAASLLANAHGQQETIQAENAMAQAQVQYRQALASRYEAQGQLAASLTNDPLQQIQDQIAGLVRALSVTQGVDARTQIQTQINQLKLQYQNTLIGQREGTIQFQLDMQQITQQQAINQLQGLLRLRNLSVQQRQDILSRIHQLQMADTQGGQFDLAPSGGNVGLPTVYDVHSLMRNAQVRPHPITGVTADASTTNINVLVRNGNDVPAVADAIERATGGKLKARLRAAGVRGM